MLKRKAVLYLNVFYLVLISICNLNNCRLIQTKRQCEIAQEIYSAVANFSWSITTNLPLLQCNPNWVQSTLSLFVTRNS